MTSEDDFQRALDARPDDQILRLTFADFLEEQDPPDPRAEGYRALGLHKRWPSDNPRRARYSYWVTNMAMPHSMLLRDWWVIWRDVCVAPRKWEEAIRRSSCLPFRLKTSFKCDDVAAIAFSLLPLDRRVELLNPSLELILD